jgi:hypothetical protein
MSPFLSRLAMGALNGSIERLYVSRAAVIHTAAMKDACGPSLDWEDLRCFAALARHRTLAGTARALNLTRAGVSLRVARLETRVGAPLFARGARGLTLTATGASVLAEAAQMEMAACAVSQMCTGNFAETVSGVPPRGHRSSPGTIHRKAT